ncbi:MAG: polyhydroxyalkanoate depolymerase, partial [Gammaproteobacteria bacterium]
MLYSAYQMQDDMLTPLRQFAIAALSVSGRARSGLGALMPSQFAAGLEMLARFKLTHTRPEFAIGSVRSGNRDVEVRQRVALALPFGDLLHFEKDVETPQPRVLVIAPLSGHFSTLLAGTVRTLLSDHDVYITDWANARDVPLSAGKFGVDDYVTYLISFLEAIGPGVHILAVCQPCVQALVAAAVMAAGNNPAAPRSMTLMAGPIDPRESPTKVNELAVKKSLNWFESMVITQVPG